MSSTKADVASVGPIYLPFINLTPHAINFYDKESKALLTSVASSGELRLVDEPSSTVQGVLCHTADGKEVIIPRIVAPKHAGLLETTPGYDVFMKHPLYQPTIFLVSMLLGNYFAEHPELVPAGCCICGPDTGLGCHRNDKGQIIGTFNLVQYADPHPRSAEIWRDTMPRDLAAAFKVCPNPEVTSLDDAV